MRVDDDFDDVLDEYDDGCCPDCGCWPCCCVDDLDVDVCQNCGGYFAWTEQLTATWVEMYKPKDSERQPQRCSRCLRDECWVEDRDADDLGERS